VHVPDMCVCTYLLLLLLLLVLLLQSGRQVRGPLATLKSPRWQVGAPEQLWGLAGRGACRVVGCDWQ
jgi:hypothetical protein